MAGCQDQQETQSEISADNVRSLEFEIENLHVKAFHLEEEVNLRNEQITSLEGDLQSVKQELLRSNTENELLHDEIIPDYLREIINLKNQVTDIQVSNRTLQQNYQQLEKAHIELQESFSSLQTLSRENAGKLVSRVKEMRNEIGELQTVLGELQSQANRPGGVTNVDEGSEEKVVEEGPEEIVSEEDGIMGDVAQEEASAVNEEVVVEVIGEESEQAVSVEEVSVANDEAAEQIVDEDVEEAASQEANSIADLFQEEASDVNSEVVSEVVGEHFKQAVSEEDESIVGAVQKEVSEVDGEVVEAGEEQVKQAASEEDEPMAGEIREEEKKVVEVEVLVDVVIDEGVREALNQEDRLVADQVREEEVYAPDNEVVEKEVEETASQPVSSYTDSELIQTGSAAGVTAQQRQIGNSIIKFLSRWEQAWENGDLRRYIDCYVNGFKPVNGLNYEDWVQNRKFKFSQHSNIQITLSEIQLTLGSGKEGQVEVQFKQVYNADQYSDVVRKNLLLVSVNNEWKIRSEYSR